MIVPQVPRVERNPAEQKLSPSLEGGLGGRTRRNLLQVFKAFLNDLFPRSRVGTLVLDARRPRGFAAAA
jgi:hypothetical protein